MLFPFVEWLHPNHCSRERHSFEFRVGYFCFAVVGVCAKSHHLFLHLLTGSLLLSIAYSNSFWHCRCRNLAVLRPDTTLTLLLLHQVTLGHDAPFRMYVDSAPQTYTSLGYFTDAEISQLLAIPYAIGSHYDLFSFVLLCSAINQVQITSQKRG